MSFFRACLSNAVTRNLAVNDMPYKLVAVLIALMLGLPSWSQDRQEQPADDAAAESAPEDAEAEDAVGNDADQDDTGPAFDLDADPELDEQTYGKDEDVFIPTEEIPVDQAIPFPTDI